ncbi:M20 family metallopeptidase [Nesterenkonia marinintestina]|uniref:M20 family metallopeptidase n=1 Tax=Nesterenkonia marinintestina TaxID=2979865 RepID=UPI0021C10E06|nr:M20 family metallopeptidase [Nesterenkonia sp. GX14115]
MRREYENLSGPSDFYLSQLDRETAQRAEAAAHLQDAPDEADGAADSGASDQLRSALETITESLRTDLIDLLYSLHQHPEVAFEEHRSAAEVAELLRRHGLDAVIGGFGLDTAVHAEVTSADFDPETDRTIAVLAEYDALVGLGHGCGHNVIAATAVGSVVSLARLLTEDPAAFRGRVVLLGTPAEEGRTGKEHMAQHGAFDDLDAAIMIHPYGYDLADQVWLGRRVLTAEFEGVSAHASAQPFQGRNALDAASLAYQGLGLLRQQMLPVDRLHAVITEGGERASIIPDRASMDLYVRSKYPESLRELSERVEDVLRGAALMTGTNLALTWDEDPPSLPVRTNSALTDRWTAAQSRRGRSPLPGGVVPETVAASTDFGNVSYRVPGIHPLLKISDSDVALHTVEFREAAGSPRAEDAAVDGAFGLAATALDFLVDDELAARVREEFEASGGAVDVPSFFD